MRPIACDCGGRCSVCRILATRAERAMRRSTAAGVRASTADVIARREAVIPPAPNSETRRLPVLVDGPGERREDCTSHQDCLGRFVKSTRGRRVANFAQCPDGCTSYEAIPREWHLEQATQPREPQGGVW